MNVGADESLLSEFLDESSEGLASLDAALVELEHDFSSTKVDAIFRPIHSLKGNSAFFHLFEVKKVAHRMENLLDLLRKGARRADSHLIGSLLAGLDLLRNMLARVHAGQPEVQTPGEVETVLAPIEALVERQEILTSSASSPVSAQTTSVTPQEPHTATTSPVLHTSEQDNKTMRVSEHAIDAFLSLVGELVVMEEMFGHLASALRVAYPEEELTHRLRQQVEALTRTGSELRASVLEIRRVPARQLLQKVPRMVREGSERLGKQVALHIEGENIRIDKSWADLLDAPLTHLVNNALDHGIENGGIRTASGKPAEGTLSVTLSESEERITLVVADDGQGVNVDRVFQKAVSLGLVAADAILDDQAKTELLLLPGLSTADKVTDISGRGVGMDVVQRSIHEAGGSIAIRSESGKGTRFTLTLPRNVTTQIVDGFVVEAGGSAFIILVGNVESTFQISECTIQSITGKQEFILHNDALHPLLRLGTTLGMPGSGRQDVFFLLVQFPSGLRAVAVERILGIQKVVVKPILGLRGHPFKGAALLGDTRLALILDLSLLEQLVVP